MPLLWVAFDSEMGALDKTAQGAAVLEAIGNAGSGAEPAPGLMERRGMGAARSWGNTTGSAAHRGTTLQARPEKIKPTSPYSYEIAAKAL